MNGYEKAKSIPTRILDDEDIFTKYSNISILLQYFFLGLTISIKLFLSEEMATAIPLWLEPLAPLQSMPIN